jgi:molecular chaperone GrpE
VSDEILKPAVTELGATGKTPSPPSDGPEAAPAIEDMLAEKDAQIAELSEHVRRVSAEFENFRRRQQEEQKRRLVLMKEDLFRSLLPVVDNLDRTVEAKAANVESLLKGVELIRRDLGRIFADNEITPIVTENAEFDPALHEAMMVDERDDLPDQSIVAELQKGYRMGERVLRPSMVRVSRQTQVSSATNQEDL